MSGTQNRVSPIVAIASVAVIIFSAIGVGVMTGIIPSSFSKSSDVAVPNTPSASSETLQSTVTPQAAERPKPATRNEPPRAAASETSTQTPRICADCGKVTTIIEAQQEGEGTGLGAVAGGVLGGVLGNQIGHGTGRKVATVAGAAGGAYVGHQAEKSIRSTKRWDVAVRMQNGTTRTFSYDQQPIVRVGDSVRVQNGQLVVN